MSFTAAEIAKALQGEVLGDASTPLTGFAPADSAKPGDLTFAENAEFFALAEQSAASAIIVAGDFASAKKTLIRVLNARVAFAKALELFFPEPRQRAGIHPSAVIAKSAQIDPSACVGPQCVVGERVRIGARAELHGGNHVGDDCKLGDDVKLSPNVVLY